MVTVGAAAEHWTQLVGNRQRGGRRPPPPGGPGGPPGRPGGRGGLAQRLRDDPSRDLTGTPCFEAVCEALGPDRTVLDIGAGPGRYTLALARAGCRVWALEPGEPMRAALNEDRARLAPETAERVVVVEGQWPQDRDRVPVVDVALASLVVHWCADGAGFLRAMDAAATRRCVLVIRGQQMNPLAAALWPQFCGERPFPAQPVLADLLPLLEEVGITANTRLVEPARDYGLSGERDEVRRRIAGMLGIEGEAELARLDAAMEPLLVDAGQGRVRAAQPAREAIVTWTPRGAAAS